MNHGRYIVRSVAAMGLLLAGTVGLAQATGKLRLIMEPAGQTEYVLDGQYRLRDREVSLLEGQHRFVFWAPERRMLDTVLTVVAGGHSEVRISLRYSEEYIQWRKRSERYESQRRLGLYVPPVVAAGAAAWMVVSYMNYSQAHRELDDLNEAYAASTDPGEISVIKSEDIPAAKDDFAKARTQTIIATSLFAVSAGATWYLRRKLSSRTAPVFEDKERTRFEGLVWVPSGTGGTWMAGLSIPLAP